MKYRGKFVIFLFALSLLINACAAQMIQPGNAPPIASASESSVSSQQSIAITQTTNAQNSDQQTASEQNAMGEDAPTAFEVPKIDPSKFNAAFVYVSPIGDGGWTYAHNQGRLLIEKFLGDKVHTAYLEGIPEGGEAEIFLRQLAQAGYQAIFTTSFGYMDATEKVAAEFPNIQFVHVSGIKKNGKNFANLFGAMEDMKYLAGMIAGARAQEDGSKRVGYIATHPFPEITRYLNATTMGMRSVCPDCVMDVRWTHSWFDPIGERKAAEEMMDAGATVIVTGADTTEPVKAAGARGLWGIGYDSDNACEADLAQCLTTPYWDWGQVYIWLLYKMFDGKFTGDDYYFEVDSNGVGLLGFMTGQKPAAGVPTSVVPEVKKLMTQMRRGGFTRFDIFTGPIRNNKGEMVVETGVTLTQSDLEGLQGVEGRPDCTICMDWLAEGILPNVEIPD